MNPCGFDGFVKRLGQVVPFDAAKIEVAVQAAVDAVAIREGGRADRSIAATVTEAVMEQLTDPVSDFYVNADEEGRRIPRIEDVQDLVEILLAERGHTLEMAAYKRYRKQREAARSRIRVRPARGVDKKRVDVTDATLLLVQSDSKGMSQPWDRSRIVKHICAHTDLSAAVAASIAKAVENRVIAARMNSVNTTLVRELVNNELAERGLRHQMRDMSLYGVPLEFVENLMFSKSTENSNIVNNNPEAVNLSIAELVLKQWALDAIFDEDIKRAHDTAAIHVHDLGYPHRVYCSSHSIEYVKKYGLRGLVNLNTESRPAKTASVLTGHLNTFLASMQANYAGALGIAHINILYAPLLRGMDDAAMKQVAQELIFNGSQNAFSRGGQTLFLDFNIHAGVPGYLKKVPAIGPGGTYMLRRADGEVVALVERLRDELDGSGYPFMDLILVEADGGERLVLREVRGESGTVNDPQVEAELRARGERVLGYGDFEEEARRFCLALLDVWGEGDSNGRIFEFPKCDFHINEETFEEPEQYKVFQAACELAATNGSTYFIFDRDEVTLSACCRLRTTIEDNRMLRHPENMRFCGFQNVTINIPQAAYRAARRESELVPAFFEELNNTLDLAVRAHLQKKARITTMMGGPGHPLWQIGQPACDGKPYVDLESATYIIGLIGVNDAVRFLIGQNLHDSHEAQRFGLQIVAHLFKQTKKLGAKHGLKFTLEESPAESAARRLAKTDLTYFREEAMETVQGETEDVCYYTNSVHLTADAPVGLVERIREQGKYHSLIESGAITHAFVGEEEPSAASIEHLMTETFFRTQSAQVTVSPEFTYCGNCQHQSRGLHENCLRCGSEDVVGETRVVGYFSKVQNWNKSKRYGELKARHAGQYAVETADPSEPVGLAPADAPAMRPRDAGGCEGGACSLY